MALYLTGNGIISILFIYPYLVHYPNSTQVNYVKTSCLTDQDRYLIFNEYYASRIDTFFLSDSIFSFDPCDHSLNIGLNISGIHNVSFIGLPNKCYD